MVRQAHHNEKPFASARKPSSWLSYPRKSKLKKPDINQIFFINSVRDSGVEPLTTVWKTVVIPIN